MNAIPIQPIDLCHRIFDFHRQLPLRTASTGAGADASAGASAGANTDADADAGAVACAGNSIKLQNLSVLGPPPFSPCPWTFWACAMFIVNVTAASVWRAF